MDPFLGQLMLVPYNFVPANWLQCSGQLLPIRQYTALFSLLGTQYGGDGKTTFALPNLQGSVPIGSGTGPGLSPYVNGQSGGSQTETLLASQMPLHTHSAMGGKLPPANQTSAGGNLFGESATLQIYAAGNSPVVPMNPAAVSSAGGGQPHNNMMPFLAMIWIIATQGIFPLRP